MANFFVDRYADENGKKIGELPEETLEVLMRYHWPGNVRELENAIERAVVLCRNGTLSSDTLPDEIREPQPAKGLGIGVGMSTAEAERVLILETLKSVENSRSKAAEILSISIRTLRNKINEYRAIGIEIP